MFSDYCELLVAPHLSVPDDVAALLAAPPEGLPVERVVELCSELISADRGIGEIIADVSGSAATIDVVLHWFAAMRKAKSVSIGRADAIELIREELSRDGLAQSIDELRCVSFEVRDHLLRLVLQNEILAVRATLDDAGVLLSLTVKVEGELPG